MKITDQMLIAYIDDELDPPARTAVEAAAAQDAVLAARLDRHRTLRARMALAFADALDEPAPAAMVAAIANSKGGPDNVVDLAQARARASAAPRRPRPAWIPWAVAAACLVAGVAVFQGRDPARVGPMITASDQGLAAGGPLAAALERQLVSDPAGAAPAVRIGLSFRTADGAYCRSFQIEHGPGLAGVACREPGRWAVRAAVASPAAAPAAGYRTAASPTPPAVADVIDGMIAGRPLDAADERSARDKGWRP